MGPLELFGGLSCGHGTDTNRGYVKKQEELDRRDLFQERINYLCLFEAQAVSREWAHLNFSRNYLEDMGLTEIEHTLKSKQTYTQNSNRTARRTE